MEFVRSIPELRAAVRSARSHGKTIGLVPTMGAMHEGHYSLMRRARLECGFVVVSLFVNPTQFGPNEDLSSYPRDLEGDAAGSAREGVDLLFIPTADEVYPANHKTSVAVNGLTERLCGRSRPSHFQGVTTVVAKLFGMAQPDRAYFGEKDYQQLQVIRRMTRDLDIPVEVIGCPIVRESDGVAMSSRNRYLSAHDRVAARVLSRSLAGARQRFAAGERSAEALLDPVRAEISGATGVALDYAELLDASELSVIERIDAPAVLAVAARVGPARLIDNTVLDPATGA